jgi:murein DD-endopeptidase MepM/ murein hydrolase activator NlpD
MKRWFFWLAFLMVVPLLASYRPVAAQNVMPYLVQPGDTWLALSIRYRVSVAQLQAANPFPNPQRQPAIGAVIQIPGNEPPTTEQMGTLIRPNEGGLLATAVRYNANPWQLAWANGMSSPARPTLYRPILIPGGDSPPQELPVGFETLELSQTPAVPGRALAFRGETSGTFTVTATLAHLPFHSFNENGHLVALVGTGAFFAPGDHELTIVRPGQPLWSQPWRMVAGTWDYQQLTLTGDAAAIDAESIAQERERLFAIWTQVTPEPLWRGPFQLPIQSYLEISATYGGRRSYNGGPYRTYHEGVDFAAYGGTPVYAPAAGNVVLAELLYVRGGAVIIDHGLGIYSGYYHMSNVLATAGQTVEAGQIVGEVGTTGLSTGNHLHWDFLVAGVWVDATVWLDQDMACWVLAGVGRGCE